MSPVDDAGNPASRSINTRPAAVGKLERDGVRPDIRCRRGAPSTASSDRINFSELQPSNWPCGNRACGRSLGPVEKRRPTAVRRIGRGRCKFSARAHAVPALLGHSSAPTSLQGCPGTRGRTGKPSSFSAWLLFARSRSISGLVLRASWRQCGSGNDASSGCPRTGGHPDVAREGNAVPEPRTRFGCAHGFADGARGASPPHRQGVHIPRKPKQGSADLGWGRVKVVQRGKRKGSSATCLRSVGRGDPRPPKPQIREPVGT